MGWEDYEQYYYPEEVDYGGYSYDDNYDFGDSYPINEYLDFLGRYNTPQYEPMALSMDSTTQIPEPSWLDKVLQGVNGIMPSPETRGNIGQAVGKNPLAMLGALGGAGMAAAGLFSSQPKIRVPEMSEQQKALQQMIMQQAGSVGEEGEVATAYKQRVLKALGGDDTVDPTLLREQEEERRLMEARLLRELGPGYLTSGSDDKLGAKILNDLNKRQSEARFTNRRQILTQDEQSRQGAAGLDLQKKSTAGNLALQGFSGLGDYAKMGLQAKMANAQTDAQRASDLVRGGSQLLGYSVGNMKSSPFDKYWEQRIQNNTTKGY